MQVVRCCKSANFKRFWGKRFLSTFQTDRSPLIRKTSHNFSGSTRRFQSTSAQTSDVDHEEPSVVPDTYWQDADFEDIMEEELNEFILSEDGEEIDFDFDQTYSDAGEKAQMMASKYSHIEGVVGLDLENLTSAEEAAISYQDSFLYGILPTDSLKDLLGYIHYDLGYSWVFIAALAPWLTKVLVVAPIAVKMQKSMEKIGPTQTESLQKLKEIQVQFGHDRALFKKKKDDLKKKYGYNPGTAPYRMLGAAIVQAPLHMTFFMSLRTMWPRFQDWKEGGALWFTDLAVPDPTWALPVICGGLFLLNVELNTTATGDNSQMQAMKGIMRFFAFMMVPILSMMPAGFTLYAVSNIAGFAVQSRLLRHDPFRKLVGLKPHSYLQSINKAPQSWQNFGKSKKSAESVKVTIGKKQAKVRPVSLPNKQNAAESTKKFRPRRKKQDT